VVELTLCPVPCVEYTGERSDAGLTVAIDVFPETKFTESTKPETTLTEAVKVVEAPLETVVELGVKSTVQLSTAGGAELLGGGVVLPGPQQ